MAKKKAKAVAKAKNLNPPSDPNHKPKCRTCDYRPNGLIKKYCMPCINRSIDRLLANDTYE